MLSPFPSACSLEAGLARRTVKMRSTPTKITYYAPGRLYAVVTRGVPNEAAMYRPLQQLENTDPFAGV